MTHKELVSEYQVREDLAKILITNLTFFIEETNKDFGLKIANKEFVNFVQDVYNLVSKYKNKSGNFFFQNELKIFHHFLKQLITENTQFKRRRGTSSAMKVTGNLGDQGEVKSIDMNEDDDLKSVAH